MIAIIESIIEDLTVDNSLEKTIIFDIYISRHNCSLDDLLDAVHMISNLKVCYIGIGYNDIFDRYNLINRVFKTGILAKFYLNKEALKLVLNKDYSLNTLDILTSLKYKN